MVMPDLPLVIWNGMADSLFVVKTFNSNRVTCLCTRVVIATCRNEGNSEKQQKYKCQKRLFYKDDFLLITMKYENNAANIYTHKAHTQLKEYSSDQKNHSSFAPGWGISDTAK